MTLLDDRRRPGSASHPGGTSAPRAVVPPGFRADPGRAEAGRAEPGRGGPRWERVADAGFYGVAASVVLLVVVRELTGTTLPGGTARGVVLGACAVVTLVVAGIVLRRR